MPARWWFQYVLIFFILIPTWGKMNPFWLAHIFQMGGKKPPPRKNLEPNATSFSSQNSEVGSTRSFKRFRLSDGTLGEK